MYKNLYDSFKHWYGRGAIYFYSDPHFGEADVADYREYHVSDDEQVKRINSRVTDRDTLVLLGDVGDIEYVKKLRGYKILIKGNHDKGTENYRYRLYCEYGPHGEHIPASDNSLFSEVYEGPLFISERILLSHEPIDCPFALNIHGHDHSNTQFQDEYHINMCAEHNNYTPVSLKEIIKSGRLKNIKSIHRQTIDEASERAKEKKHE